MMSKKAFTAVVAAAGLIFGSAHAAPEATEGMPGEMPGVIILDLGPAAPGAGEATPSEQEQAMMTMLLLQLLGVMGNEGAPVEVQMVAPSPGERI
jgi:hypothetical protein